MTVIARAGRLSSPSARESVRPSYAHAHWYMLAAFAVVLLGFWPTFYQPLTSGTTLRNVHGVTATLWYTALVVQPWLVTNGYVRWHRRVAVAVIALLPVLTVTALMNTRVMLTRGALPPMARPLCRRAHSHHADRRRLAHRRAAPVGVPHRAGDARGRAVLHDDDPGVGALGRVLSLVRRLIDK